MAKDIIPFPKNYERYLQLAQEALNKNQYEEAMENFEGAYEISPEFPLSYLMVDTLIKMGDFSRAKELVDEFLEVYQGNQDFLDLYVQVMIGSHDFLRAFELVNKRLVTAHDSQVMYLIQLKKLIEISEGHFRKQHQTEISKIKEEKTQLSQQALFAQISYVQNIQKLPHVDFIDLGKEIISDEAIHSVVRGGILDRFQRIHYEGEVTFIDYTGKKHQVVPAMLEGIWENRVYQTVMQIMENKLLHDDPISFNNLLIELRMLFAILFPYGEEVIQDPKLFAEVYLVSSSLIRGNKAEELKKLPSYLKYEALINQLKAMLYEDSM